MSSMMDIERYLERIDYDGPLRPAAETLHLLHLAHLRSVPFENLDIHLGRPIVLDLDALYDKIVVRRRGGFCYELNGLFAQLLRELGFDVTLLSARVADENGDCGQEFDHLTLQVRCASQPHSWLADVGFGDSFSEPLRLDGTAEVQRQGSRAYHLRQEGKNFVLWQRKADASWQIQYRYTQKPRLFAEFRPRCFYLQTSPDSHFTQKRICTLATENGRITLSDQRFIVTENGLRRERTVSREEGLLLLEQRFGVQLEEANLAGENENQ